MQNLIKTMTFTSRVKGQRSLGIELVNPKLDIGTLLHDGECFSEYYLADKCSGEGISVAGSLLLPSVFSR